MRLGWLVVVAAACGSDPPPDTTAITASEAAAACAKECQRDDTCSGVDPTCQDTCVADVVGWARRDAIEAIASCIAKLSCDLDPDETCLPKILPLEIHKTWATKCLAQLADCTNVDPQIYCEVEYDLTDIDLGFVRLIAPDIVDEMMPCLDAADCTARVACTDAVYTAHGIQ